MDTYEVTKLRTLERMLDVLAEDVLRTPQDGDISELVTENAAAVELHTDMVFSEIDHIQGVRTQLDPDGSLVRAVEETRNKFAAIHETLTAKRDVLGHNQKDHEDLLEACDRMLAATVDLHNVINDLCWHIGEHDADLEQPISGSFSTAEDLFASMGV